MNWIIKIGKVKTYAVLALLGAASLSSCINDDLSNCPESDNQGFSATVHAPNRFMAFKIYVENDARTRATFDASHADGSIKGEDQTEAEALLFNKGLDFERALYFPKSKTQDYDTEDYDLIDGETEGEEDGEDPEDNPGDDDPEEEEDPQLYHFALLINENGSLKAGPLKLDLEEPDDDDLYYTVYTKFYSPEDEENPYQGFEGSVWVVLNASYSLQRSVETAIQNNAQALENIRRALVSSTMDAGNSDDDNFLYLKDKNGEYILDKDGNPYFTMSSSMIVKNNQVIPAVIPPTGGTAFQMFDSETDARSNPTSIYVERLQAKYTVLFVMSDGSRIGTDGNLINKNIDNNNKYYLTSSPLPTNQVTGGFIPTNRLIIAPAPVDENGKITTSGLINEIRYVTSYNVSPSIDERNNVEVKKTRQWKINILGWGVNSLEYTQYLFKSLNPASSYFTGWNSSLIDYRNFWAEDVNYNKSADSYPDQYRRSEHWVKKDDSYSFEPDPNVKSVAENPSYTLLKYYNFKEMSKRNPRNYTAENTFTTTSLGSDPITSKSYLRVGSHIIIAAQLIIEDNKFESTDVLNSQDFNSEGLLYKYTFDVADKYLMNGIYWSASAYKNYVSEYMGYWLLEERNKKIFGETDGMFYMNKNKGRATGNYFKFVDANVENGDAMVYLLPDRTLMEDLYVYNPNSDAEEEEDKYRRVTDEEIRILFFGIEGDKNYPDHKNYMAQRLLNGRMYYAAGTNHNVYGDYYKGYSSDVTLGDFGTVRNHWYYFVVDGFTTPGTPVSVPTQKIVPNPDPINVGLGVSLTVLDWHRVFADPDVSDQHRPGSSN